MKISTLILTSVLGTALLASQKVPAASTIQLKAIGTHETGIFDGSASEFVAHDPLTQRLFVVNANQVRIDVLSIRNPKKPQRVASLDFSGMGGATTCASIYNGIVAVSVQAERFDHDL